MVTATMRCLSQPLELATEGISAYSIYLPANPSRTELKAAGVLKDYFYRVTGAILPVETDNKTAKIKPGFLIRNLPLSERASVPYDGFTITTLQKDILFTGNGNGTLYAVYEFIEKYLGCRKWDGGTAWTPHISTLSVQASINEAGRPVMQYREVYLPPAFDNEYLDWHKLHRFESIWGLWGHSFYKLVPPSVHFRNHPEYFSLVDGERVPLQLCLSNPTVVKLTVARLTKLIHENPESKYWSVSPNDDIGNCECDDCKKLDEADGGPQGSLLHFVNTVAAYFPDKIITTLAYGYSARAPIVTRPSPNVAIMLSSIDAYRSPPLTLEPSAAAFRNNLRQWKEKSPHVFVWDYCTQFTNYLAPFPVTQTLGPNISFLAGEGVTGIFEQGSGDTYSDMAELKSYVAAKLLWNPAADADSITSEFLSGYYGKAADAVRSYHELLQKRVMATGTRLDIYGNPVNEYAGYLSPADMDAYSSLMDKAETVAENDPVSLRRVKALRLTLEYVYLQQSKFYGKDKHGVFIKNGAGDFVTRPGLPGRVTHFTASSTAAGVKEFSEGGPGPSRYAEQWASIFATGAGYNLAANSKVTLAYPYVPEYPSKKERTLVDETPGYEDFSYNWLCFYGVPMEATVDMGAEKKVTAISMHFLEDARHWIFRPASIIVETSVDGIHYLTVNTLSNKMGDEDFTLNFMPFRFAVNDTIRFIRIKATNWPALPAWRHHKFKKPMIACDEIWVE